MSCNILVPLARIWIIIYTKQGKNNSKFGGDLWDMKVQIRTLFSSQ